MVILISIVSLITTLIGLYYVGEKNKVGFILYIISLLCQTYLFCKIDNWFLVVQMFVLIVFNAVNYFKWRKDEKNEHRPYWFKRKTI